MPLLTPGSQISVISHSTAQRLKLTLNPVSTTIFGIGQKRSKPIGMVNAVSNPNPFVNSRLGNNFAYNLYSASIGSCRCRNTRAIQTNFHISAPVDFFLGSEVYTSVLAQGDDVQHEHVATYESFGDRRR